MANTILKEANFYNSVLTGVDFSEADLAAADFQGARLDHVDFSGADLSSCKGLTKAEYDGAVKDSRTIAPKDFAE